MDSFECTAPYMIFKCYFNALLCDFQHVKEYYRVIKQCNNVASQYDFWRKWRFQSF